MRLSRSEGGQQRRHSEGRLAVKEYVDRREPLIVHAPAVVQMVIDRYLNNARRRHTGAKCRFQNSGKIQPVETQNNVGLTYRIGGLCSDPYNAGRPDMKLMVGGACSSDLEISGNPRTQTLRKRDARIPSLEVPRHAPRGLADSSARDTRPARIIGCLAFRNRSAARLMRSGGGALSAGGMNRLALIGATGSASLFSCISASKLTYVGPRGAVFAIQFARSTASRAAIGETG